MYTVIDVHVYLVYIVHLLLYNKTVTVYNILRAVYVYFFILNVTRSAYGVICLLCDALYKCCHIHIGKVWVMLVLGT
jgi:hypothetical protein